MYGGMMNKITNVLSNRRDSARLLVLFTHLVLNGYYDLMGLVLALCNQVNESIIAYPRLIAKLGGCILRETQTIYCLEFEGLKWKIRKTISTDFKFGVLLDIVGEPYQYWRWFDKYLDNVETFIDVGAYIGGYSVRALRKNVDVYAIEVNPKNFELLSSNLKMNCQDSTAISYNIAAGSRKETKALYMAASRDGFLTSSLVGADGRDFVGEIEVYPLDDLFLHENLKKPIFVKIDVEGFELDVIKGAKHILMETDYVMVEVSNETRLLVDKVFNTLNFRKVDRYRTYSFYIKKNLYDKT
jgi:FkbM family methyltransferase